MKINSRIKDYELVFVDNFDFVDQLLKLKYYAVIVGSNVYSLYKNIFSKFPKKNIIVLTLDENNKTIDTVIEIYKKLLKQAAKKNLTIISFGGGINQDVVGFAASTLYRGVNWIHIPTTLLSMADSSVGLKTSLNFSSYKNVIGTFYPPSKIFVNVDFLKTLHKLDYFSGVGEIIKLYLMRKNPIGNLNKTIRKIESLVGGKDRKKIAGIINEALKIKLDYMKGDEFDIGRRNLLNYGHELGHALEPASFFNIPHGVAVLIGIIFANIVSLKRKMITKDTFDKLNKLLLIPSIPFGAMNLKKEYFNEDTIINNMKKDKKRIDEGLVLVLPQKDFSLIKVNDLTVDECKSCLLELKKIIGVS